MHEDAREIFMSCLEEIDPCRLVKKALSCDKHSLTAGGERYDLSAYENIYVVGAGKAGAAMGRAVEEVLGKYINSGYINVKYGHSETCDKIVIKEAGHPIPDLAGVNGADEILRILEKSGDNDLVICLISGGGSALLCSPANGINLEDKQEATSVLLKCGADITKLNAVRKHLSSVKGGQMARVAYPSDILVLILSDVIGDPLDAIASGPTSPDHTTFEQCLSIIEEYNIAGRMPPNVMKRLNNGASGLIPENPRADDPIFKKVRNLIVGNNSIAISAAESKAKLLGYITHIITEPVQGETMDAAFEHTAVARQILKSDSPVSCPACIISGGETTVKVTGDGLGGRNQEFALAAAMDIDDFASIVVLSGGTDGTDGPTDAAGAVADHTTCRRAGKLNLCPYEFMDRNDSYHFFEKLDDLLITGPTKTNVMDIHILLVKK